MKNYIWSISFLVLGASCGMMQAGQPQSRRAILSRPKSPTEKLQEQQQAASESYKQRLDLEAKRRSIAEEKRLKGRPQAQQRRLEEKRLARLEEKREAQSREKLLKKSDLSAYDQMPVEQYIPSNVVTQHASSSRWSLPRRSDRSKSLRTQEYTDAYDPAFQLGRANPELWRHNPEAYEQQRIRPIYLPEPSWGQRLREYLFGKKTPEYERYYNAMDPKYRWAAMHPNEFEDLQRQKNLNEIYGYPSWLTSPDKN